VIASYLFLPKAVPQKFFKRKHLWNELEKKETMKKGYIGYEIILAIPYELKMTDSCDLIKSFSKTLSEFYHCAVDSSIHVPPDNSDVHDKRNIHAHILLSKRQFDKNGYTRKLIGLNKRHFRSQIELIRKCWEILVNDYLSQSGCSERVDHRSLAKQGINRIPQIHVGKRAKYLHFSNNIPKSKKKEINGGLIMKALIKDGHGTNSTKKLYRSTKSLKRSRIVLYPRR
jgi:hypothetical protein